MNSQRIHVILGEILLLCALGMVIYCVFGLLELNHPPQKIPSEKEKFYIDEPTENPTFLNLSKERFNQQSPTDKERREYQKNNIRGVKNNPNIDSF